MLRIGVDIGGTFTDFAIWRDESDGYVQIGSRKVPTSRPNLAEAVTRGIAEIAAEAGLRREDPLLVVHGTTVSTNAVIERSQPAVALLTTAGFRDILGIARLRLDKPVDLFNRRVAPLVPRERVFPVAERLLADGRVETPLDEAGVVAAARRAAALGARGIAVCFLHAHRNPVHERRAVELIRASCPGLEAMASHEVWPQQSEYERAVLTLLNIYVKPLMAGYIGEIDGFLRARFPNARLYITKSNGGVMSAEEARHLPIHTLLSGPAAGVTAAQALGGLLGLDRILTFDMGGTSTDVSLIDRGRALHTGQAEVGDFPLLMPVTSVEAMGAGGGSVIWLDGGILKVGPRSAGSQPGPACYGLGGTRPTLTDAYLLAGYLGPDGLLGGRLRLDRGLAEAAIAPLAQALGMEVVALAEAAIEVATSSMLARITPFLARMGVGAADLTLMIFGGAGGVHGPILAEEIGIRRIVVPRIPSVFCAFGGLVSDLVHDAVRSVQGEAMDAAAMREAFAALAAEGTAWLERQSHAGQVIGVEREMLAEMRYAAQSFTIPIDLGAALAAGDAAVLEAFHAEHERLFGHANRDAAVATDTLRLRTIGRQRKPSDAPLPPAAATAVAPRTHRRLRFGRAWVEAVPVFDWADLPPGWETAGPAVVRQDLATILIPPGYAARVGPRGDLDMTRS